MRKIVEGLIYDTETAVEIARESSELSVTDFRYFSETLYKTKKGRYFLHGQGNAMSRYAEPVGNMAGAGEDIVPFTDAETKRWLEVNQFISILEDEFGEIEEA